MQFLGQQVNTPTQTLECIPWNGPGIEVKLDCSEFTSHCPVTKQPDFGELEIVYMPDKQLVETKSLKLFLWSFRECASFNEALVASIARTFSEQVQPVSVAVTGRFHSRGGISVTARCCIGGSCNG